MSNWNKGPLLGRGSTAIVSLASDPISGQLFAVKSTCLSHSGFLKYEKGIHSSVSSPHIISYLGYDSDNDFYNLFLEYASGGSISDLIQKQKLQESEIRSFVKDILLGLNHLHSLKIAHCDIKCQNILITGDGRAKIADFGCAKYIDCDNQIRAKLRGTPMFMAPEVARGEEQMLASDVWALGCTIIEMATGRAPWLNVSDAGSLLYRVGFTEDLPEIPEWISDSGKEFLSKCLAKDAGNRATVDELLMHPFLTGTDVDVGYKWVTPRSVLENNSWDSVSENEPVVDFRNDRISDVIGSRDGPEWSWDDSWLTVRNESLFTCVTVVRTLAAVNEELSELRFEKELLEHPFLTVTGLDTRTKRDTHKCILESSVWDSVSGNEGVLDFGSDRILDMRWFGDGPNWSWDGSWETVRNESLVNPVFVATSATAISEELSEFSNDSEVCDYRDVNYVRAYNEEVVNVSEICTKDLEDDDIELIINANHIFGVFEIGLAIYALIAHSLKILLCFAIIIKGATAGKIKKAERLESPIAFEQGAWPAI